MISTCIIVESREEFFYKILLQQKQKLGGSVVIVGRTSPLPLPLPYADHLPRWLHLVPGVITLEGGDGVGSSVALTQVSEGKSGGGGGGGVGGGVCGGVGFHRGGRSWGESSFVVDHDEDDDDEDDASSPHCGAGNDSNFGFSFPRSSGVERRSNGVGCDSNFSLSSFLFFCNFCLLFFFLGDKNCNIKYFFVLHAFLSRVKK